MEAQLLELGETFVSVEVACCLVRGNRDDELMSPLWCWGRIGALVRWGRMSMLWLSRKPVRSFLTILRSDRQRIQAALLTDPGSVSRCAVRIWNL
jgi:hypothetical protein